MGLVPMDWKMQTKKRLIRNATMKCKSIHDVSATERKDYGLAK